MASTTGNDSTRLSRAKRTTRARARVLAASSPGRMPITTCMLGQTYMCTNIHMTSPPAAPRPAEHCRCGTRRRYPLLRGKRLLRRTRGEPRLPVAARGARCRAAADPTRPFRRAQVQARALRPRSGWPAARRICRSAGTGSSRDGSSERSGSRHCHRRQLAPAQGSGASRGSFRGHVLAPRRLARGTRSGRLLGGRAGPIALDAEQQEEGGGDED
jgi:hypothetical protein